MLQIALSQFLVKCLHQTPDGEFRCAIWHEISETTDSRHRWNSDNVAAAFAQHVRQKCLQNPEMSHYIYVEEFANLLGVVIQERMGGHYAGVIHDYRNMTDFVENFVSQCKYFVPLGYIATGRNKRTQFSISLRDLFSLSNFKLENKNTKQK